MPATPSESPDPRPAVSPATGPLGLRLGTERTGESVRVPGSKSIAQRCLVAGALCSGVTRLVHVPRGADVEACVAVVRGLGAQLRRMAPGAWELRGRPLGHPSAVPLATRIDVGESGTLARIMTAALALDGGRGECRVAGTGSLERRNSRPLFRALERAHVALEFDGEWGAWPVNIRPLGPPPTLQLDGPMSSQEVTGLLLAAASFPDSIELEVTGAIPSQPYVELTRTVLDMFGVDLEVRRAERSTVYLVGGPYREPARPVAVEVDASLAAVALCAGCLGAGPVSVAGVGCDSAQGDVRIVEYLRAFGCDAAAERDRLWAGGRARLVTDLDLRGEPDLAPPLAIVAADAVRRLGGVVRMSGLGTLPRKESDRLRVLSEGLERAGWSVQRGPEALAISGYRGPSAGRGPLVFDPADDHRMAFAFGLLGLIEPRVFVARPACVEKSWPEFWSALKPLGVHAVELPAPGGPVPS